MEQRTLFSFAVDPTGTTVSASAAAGATPQQVQTNPAHASDSFSYPGSEFEPAYSLTAAANASYQATPTQLTLHADASQSTGGNYLGWPDNAGTQAEIVLSFNLTAAATVQIAGSLAGAGGGMSSVHFDISDFVASSADTSAVNQAFKLSAGNHVIEVDAEGANVQGNSTGTLDLTLTLAPSAPPRITSPRSKTFRLGEPSAFTVTTTGNPSIKENAFLPDGLAFVDNGDGTATLSGTPSPLDGTGHYNLIFTASNGASPDAHQFFTLTLDGAPGSGLARPKFTSKINLFTFHSGQADAFMVAATGTPTPTLSVVGTLPAGVSFQDNHDGTGSFFGEPGLFAGGKYKVVVVASDDSGHHVQHVLTLDVISPPLTPADLTPKPTAPARAIIPRSKKNPMAIHFSNPQRESFKGTLPVSLYASPTPTYNATTATALASQSVKVALAPNQAKAVPINFPAPASIAAGDYYIVAIFADGTTVSSDATAHFGTPTASM
ncbi:MAG TPA: putative Ig domain-containing protein [Tepidisphaeraceae bacterium]|nr:putative Ig domain-containing protein [Tepidisphaeraceae bacterium]